MSSTWWAEFGGQVAVGVVVAAIGAIGAALTPWGKKAMSRIVSALQGAGRFIASVRVTTRARIDAEVADAVERATDSDDDDGEGRPLQPEEHRGWVMLPAPTPRTWMLRNQTGEDAVVEMIMMAASAYFDWEPPEYPIALKDGASLSFPARRVRTSFNFMPFLDNPMANVMWQDSHGDEREDVIWIVVNR